MGSVAIDIRIARHKNEVQVNPVESLIFIFLRIWISYAVSLGLFGSNFMALSYTISEYDGPVFVAASR